jgi:hypothetical protein
MKVLDSDAGKCNGPCLEKPENAFDELILKRMSFKVPEDAWRRRDR